MSIEKIAARIGSSEASLSHVVSGELKQDEVEFDFGFPNQVRSDSSAG